MPMPTAATRKSAINTMSRAMPRSLLRGLRRLRRLRLGIWKKSSSVVHLVIHQASVPHQGHYWPHAGFHINARSSVRQKIDGEADRLDTIDGTGAAVQYCLARRIVDCLGQPADFAKLVIGLKHRLIFEAADRNRVCVICLSPGRSAL